MDWIIYLFIYLLYVLFFGGPPFFAIQIVAMKKKNTNMMDDK
jgi:hypothetical protein